MTFSDDDLRASHRQLEQAARAASHHIKGFRFVATMQPRTPLYVLLRDGEVWPLERDLPAPDYPPWAGTWSFLTRSFEEVGISVPEAEPGPRATHAGPLPADEILPFLISFRRNVEGAASRDEALFLVRTMQLNNRWAWLIDAHGGAEKMVDASGCFPARP